MTRSYRPRTVIQNDNDQRKMRKSFSVIYSAFKGRVRVDTHHYLSIIEISDLEYIICERVIEELL